MKKTVSIAALILGLAATSYAVPMSTPQFGAIPPLDRAPAEGEHYLAYYNMCSGWVFYSAAHCDVWFWDAPLPAMFGTCFDLADCPADCRHLEEVWWAWHLTGPYSLLDVEIYCADDDCCPIGPPMAGLYGVLHYGTYPWKCFSFDGLPLCPCEEEGTGKFIVMLTYDEGYEPGVFPYSDVNPKNIEAGCETEWRCTGHSFVYRNLVSYCEVYGAPAPLWANWFGGGCTNYPTVPPGCHEGVTPGYYLDWVIHCYVSCQGPTAAEETSWSEIKGLYR